MTLDPRQIEGLRGVRDGVRGLAAAWTESRLGCVEWLPHQAELLRDAGMYRLLRTGNQVGKTEVGIGEVLFASLGYHPYRRPTFAHGEYWIVCASWSQSVAIQGKLWSLVPRSRVRPGTQFTDAHGFGGRNPHVAVLHEDGHYSVVRFKTTAQETLDLASATIDGALFDEPPRDRGVYSEVQKRVQANAGWMLLTMTPIGADVGWLKAMADEGVISEHHTPFEASCFIPVGRVRPLRVRSKQGQLYEWNDEWVSTVRRLTPPDQRAIRLDGGWDVADPESYYHDVWNSSMVLDECPDLEVVAQVGIDHGHRPGKQYGCFLYLARTAGTEESPDGELVVIVADEYSDEEGVADVQLDAEGLLAMLVRNGWEWSELDFVGGDRDHMPGTSHRKSNRDLELAIAALLDAPGELEPRIRTVKRGAGRHWGSVEFGCRWIYRLMARRRFFVLRRCRRMRAALRQFRLRNRDDEWKDILDALRYGLENRIFGARAGAGGPSVRIG